MNIVYRYLRRNNNNSEDFWLKYFGFLAFKHKDLIMKHCKMIDVEEVYSRVCVKKLPLILQYKKSLDQCDNPTLVWNQHIKRHGNWSSIYNTECLKCWIETLEDFDKSIDRTTFIPDFLKDKKRTTNKPTKLLEKTGLPKFLK